MSATFSSFNPSNNPHVDHIKSTVDALSTYIEANIAPSRRRSIALTELEGAAMWAVKSVFDPANLPPADAYPDKGG